MSKHVLSVLVENKPGVLARVSSMFARRGFNIHSLAVGPSAESGMSRMTVVVDGPEMEQVVKQLRKLINTIKVTELVPEATLEREVMLVRVNAEPQTRGEILDSASIFKAKAVDVGASSITFEVTGNPGKTQRLPRSRPSVRDRRSGQVGPRRYGQGRKGTNAPRGEQAPMMNLDLLALRGPGGPTD